MWSLPAARERDGRFSTPMNTLTCDYCGLDFAGSGYSPDGRSHYCCYGCYLVRKIVRAKGESAVASWTLIRFGIGAFLAMNVMMVSLIFYATPEAQMERYVITALRWALLIFSTPAITILGYPFVQGSLGEIRRGRAGTDLLAASGSAAAYGVSAAHVIMGHGSVYFDTATMLLLIMTLGRLLESIAKCRTSEAIRGAIDLLPDTASVIRDGVETSVATSDVLAGDTAIVRPGERIPTDGLIASGCCTIEESAFTGESRPRRCEPGEEVFGGSINCDGVITVTSTAAMEDSLATKIRAIVRESRRSSAPVERIAGRIASVFTPAVWAVSLAALLYWGGVRHDVEKAAMSSLAVLVVACPCALGLATPMAVSLAVGRAARHGVLIRSGEALERLWRLRSVVFDKTGTLTDNRLTVSGVRIADGLLTEDEIIARAASLESGSEHSIGRAIVREAVSRGLSVPPADDFEVVPGRGLRGSIIVDGEPSRTTIGSLKLLATDHAVPPSLLDADEYDLGTMAYIGWDGEVRASISFAETIRPESAKVVEDLRRMGLHTAIVSGDLETPVRRLAKQLGIDTALAGCTPTSKVDALRGIRAKHGDPVAFVGDGINDAPAIAEADLGFAIGSGTDLARHSSDITLMGDDLARIPWTIDLSKQTYRAIKRNLLFAFGYNTITLILASLGYVHPLIAAIAMFASSMSVVGSSMRLAGD